MNPDGCIISKQSEIESSIRLFVYGQSVRITALGPVKLKQIKMDGLNSFSIDALLSKEPRRPRDTRPSSCSSTNSDDNQPCSPTPTLAQRTPTHGQRTPTHGHRLSQHPAPVRTERHTSAAVRCPAPSIPRLVSFLDSGPPLLPGMAVIPGSAFQAQGCTQQALSMAQAQHIQNLQLDWFARTGMYMPRVIEFDGKSSCKVSHTNVYFFLFSIAQNKSNTQTYPAVKCRLCINSTLKNYT